MIHQPKFGVPSDDLGPYGPQPQILPLYYTPFLTRQFYHRGMNLTLRVIFGHTNSMTYVKVRCKTCDKPLSRLRSSIEPSGNIFCSSSCFAKYSNRHRITRLTLARQQKISKKPVCANQNCQKQIGLENKIYCSPECRFFDENEKSKNYVLQEIQKFVKKFGRVPIKYELPNLSSRGRHCFGTWNKAVKVAGYTPNEVIFSKKFTANDGHKCDSLSEKIIDDWLFARKIPHLIKVKYPWKNSMTADFKVGDYWIELFGLCGQLKSYDNLMKLKLENIKKYKLKLIGLYLSDLFPTNHLEEKLSILRK